MYAEIFGVPGWVLCVLGFVTIISIVNLIIQIANSNRSNFTSGSPIYYPKTTGTTDTADTTDTSCTMDDGFDQGYNQDRSQAGRF